MGRYSFQENTGKISGYQIKADLMRIECLTDSLLASSKDSPVTSNHCTAFQIFFPSANVGWSHSFCSQRLSSSV